MKMMTEEYNLKRIITIMIGILITILIFYGITILVTDKKSSDTINDTDTEIQTKEILIGSIYNKTESEYYVLVQLSADYSNMYSTVSAYQEADLIKLYTADLNSVYNKKYFGAVSNFTTTYPTFSKTTLIKITNGVITSYYEGVDQILDILTVE